MTGVAGIARSLTRGRRSNRKTRVNHVHHDGPDFLCIGSQKAGTQWLYDQLAHHPGVWMPPIKELHFFDGRFRRERAAAILGGAKPGARRGRGAAGTRARNLAFLRKAETYDAATSGIDWYAGLFAMKDGLLSGDITPGYSMLGPADVQGIVNRFPGLKIIFLVRHPVDRLWSQYNLELRRGVGPAVSEATGRESVEEFLNRADVQARSFPARIYRTWLTALPPGRIFTGLFDDLSAEPAGLRSRILTFLGLDPAQGEMVTVNRKAALAKIERSPEITQLLEEYFADEILAAAQLFGGAALGWSRKAS